MGICTGHDSSACILRNGRIEAFAEEERFSIQNLCKGFRCWTEICQNHL